MYIQSEELVNEIQEIANKVSEKTNGDIVFEEYIPLPHYGNIILRFELHKEEYTITDLDSYEDIMYEIVQDKFLVDFMGSVYKKVGLHPSELNRILSNCYEKYKEETVTKSVYADCIQSDAKYLLESCGLSSDLEVWEIQLEDEINLLILGESFKELGVYPKDTTEIHVYEIGKMECEGLMKATMYAKRNKISLVRALLEA